MDVNPKTDFIRRILVVDDDRELAELLAEVLTYENCVTDVASNGYDALEQLRVYDYEAVICDLMMPRMNGQVFYKKLIQDHPYLTQKVLFVSGELTHRSGMSDFVYCTGCPLLEKPFKIEEFRSALHKVFRC
jgi:DNA-binding response OmpR family regulator